MDTKTKFLELKQAWKTASEAERKQIEQETDLFLDSLSESEKKEITQAVDDDFKAIHQEIAEIQQVLNIRKKLSHVLPVISVSYLAKNYFHKTPQWFYQRLNGNKVNGKPAKFSDTEIQTLNYAIQDIRQQLSAVQF
ncbi:MAG: DUF5053 domain-containing protein [Dysgonamonadaceae bacterium]|jgi:hypothetical protein|nr:DUF5053 domain-containing protein [Dysgonamonadaceae bacterium]